MTPALLLPLSHNLLQLCERNKEVPLNPEINGPCILLNADKAVVYPKLIFLHICDKHVIQLVNL